MRGSAGGDVDGERRPTIVSNKPWRSCSRGVTAAELAKLATLISEELFSKQEKNDQKLFGFILKMNNNIVKILPLTNDTKNLQNLRASSCPDGWTDHGVCYSSGCVKKKVTLALAPAEDTNVTYEVRVIRTSTHVRICSRVI